MSAAPAYEVSLTFEAREGMGRWLRYHTHSLDEARMIWELIRQAAEPAGEWVQGAITSHGDLIERLDTLAA